MGEGRESEHSDSFSSQDSPTLERGVGSLPVCSIDELPVTLSRLQDPPDPPRPRADWINTAPAQVKSTHYAGPEGYSQRLTKGVG